MIRSPWLVALLLTLAACNSDPEPTDTGLAGYDPDRAANEQAACLARDGRWSRGGKTSGFVCQEETKDANASCRAATDCQGVCLARSGTCAPVTPIFGCNEVLNSLGARSTLCVE